MKYENKFALVLHLGHVPTVDIEQAYEEAVRLEKVPHLLTFLDADGGTVTFTPANQWGWTANITVFHQESRSGYADLHAALGDWQSVRRLWAKPWPVRQRFTEIPMPKLGDIDVKRMSQLGHTRSHTRHIVEGVTHHIDKAHRVAAQDSVPFHVIVPRDAKVTQVEEDGRVTGVWVDAKVFVSLSNAKAKGL